MIWRYIIFAGCILLISISSCQEKTPSHVCPYPENLGIRNGSFILNGNVTILADKESEPTGQWLSKKLNLPVKTGIEASEGRNIVLKITAVPWNLGPEGYKLTSSPEQIEITASSNTGLFYGAQTLLQLLPPQFICWDPDQDITWKVPSVDIEDKPRFTWRGVLLDLSRHYFGPETIRKLIDRMAVLKLNRLHLHLSDNPGWRIEIKEYPELTQIGGKGSYSDPDSPVAYLTEVDARALAAYAKERHVTIVPEIDLPGHSGAIGRVYPSFSRGDST